MKIECVCVCVCEGIARERKRKGWEEEKISKQGGEGLKAMYIYIYTSYKTHGTWICWAVAGL